MIDHDPGPHQAQGLPCAPPAAVCGEHHRRSGSHWRHHLWPRAPAHPPEDLHRPQARTRTLYRYTGENITHYCIHRAPNNDKDSREQFEIRTHSRLLDVKDLSEDTINRLLELDLPAGVDVDVKLNP